MSGKWVSGRSEKEWGVDVGIGVRGWGRQAASDKSVMLGQGEEWRDAGHAVSLNNV